MKDYFVEKGFLFEGKGYKPLCVTPKGLLVYKKHELFILNQGRFDSFVKFPSNLKSRMKEINRLAERITRSEPQSAIFFENSIVVARRHCIETYDFESGLLMRSDKYRKSYIHTDRLIKIEGVGGFDDCIAYGEYFANSKREEVCLYFRKKGETKWSKSFEFPAGAVRHIHSIVPDKHNSCVYILTGDEDKESGIWRATDNFRTVEPIVVGNQNFRCCIAFPSPDYIVYTTDIPSRQNYVTRLNLVDRTIEKVVELPGSCTVGCCADGINVFCTSVEAREPASRSRWNMIKYLLSRKLGDGIKDKFPRMYAQDSSGTYKEILKCEKDFWPGGLCRFGRILPVYDENDRRLYVFPIAVKKYDGRLYSIKISALRGVISGK